MTGSVPAFVQWIGAQRDVLHGQIHGRIALSELRGLPNLYAVGPLEGVTGEVSVFKGTPAIARIANKRVTVEASFDVKACFLVYADVPRWREVTMPTLLHERDIETLVVRTAVELGLDGLAPFPFLLRGMAMTAACHVLDKRDGGPHTPELHERAKVRFTIQGAPVDVIGFHSEHHRGIFTPGDANVHMHLRTCDGRWSGHLERLRLAPGWTLGIPVIDHAEVTR